MNGIKYTQKTQKMKTACMWHTCWGEHTLLRHNATISTLHYRILLPALRTFCRILGGLVECSRKLPPKAPNQVQYIGCRLVHWVHILLELGITKKSTKQA